jgi:hypothetical protein
MWQWRYAVILPIAGLTACVTPMLEFKTERPAIVQTTLEHAGIKDGRQSFRATFCSLITRELSGPDAECGQWITTLSDEAATNATFDVVGEPPHPTFDIVLVSGIFAECLGEKPKLLGDGLEILRRKGYQLSYAPVRGRASSHENARIIRDHILRQRARPSALKTVIVSYSKGTSDTMTALAEYPELAPSVAAVISLAGVVNGSPLADDIAAVYAATFAKLPYSDCPVVDGKEVESLTREQRHRWISQRSLPAGILYFSIVGTPEPKRVSRLLKPFYQRLAYMDPLNDGQVVFYDAVIPGSTVLAYVNADHWAIAFPFEGSRHGFAIDQNHFPRAQMFEAAVRMAEARLSARKPP